MMVNTTVGPERKTFFFRPEKGEEESRNLHNRPSGKTLEPITGLMDPESGRVIAINVQFLARLSDALALHFCRLNHRAPSHTTRGK
jgi:hypothetical protein